MSSTPCRSRTALPAPDGRLAARVAVDRGVVVRPVVVRPVVVRPVVLRDRVVWLTARGDTGLAPRTHSWPQLVQRIMLRPSSAIPRYSAAVSSHVGHASAIALPLRRLGRAGAAPSLPGGGTDRAGRGLGTA